MDKMIDDAHMDSHVVQNNKFFEPYITPSIPNVYSVSIQIPTHIFNDGYPTEIGTRGYFIRKIRMDCGLSVKEFARKIGATPDSVINWEIRNMSPSQKYRIRILEFLENEIPDERQHFLNLVQYNDILRTNTPTTIGAKPRSAK